MTDDPYYCGMKAHIPNFAAKHKSAVHPPLQSTIMESPYAKTWMMAPYPSSHHPPQLPPPPLPPQQHIKPHTVRPVMRPHESIYDSGLGKHHFFF